MYFNDTKFIHCYITVFSLMDLIYWNNTNWKITRIQMTGYNKQQMHKFGVFKYIKQSHLAYITNYTNLWAVVEGRRISNTIHFTSWSNITYGVVILYLTLIVLPCFGFWEVGRYNSLRALPQTVLLCNKWGYNRAP